MNVDLSTAINSEALKTLLSNEAFMGKVKDSLPPSERSPSPPVSQEVASTIQSPQFQSALGIFSSALQSGQLGPLMRQFGLSNTCVLAADNGDMEAFVKALEESEKEKKDEKNDGKQEKKDKNDDKKDDKDSMDMALD